MTKQKTILLTFDVEEADILNDYGKVSKQEEFETSKKGLLKLIEILNKHNIKATFFTTANFAKKYPKLIKSLHKQGHEIACHGYYHSDCYSKEEHFCNITPAKKQIEKIINHKINGFRAPRFEINKISSLKKLGFKYDSSIHPTFIPGRYINLFKKRKVHNIGEIIEIPPSTLPILRLPISWIFFKNTSSYYHRLFTKVNFSSSDYTMLLFHPWEFTDLTKYKLPFYIKSKALAKLEKYILFSKKRNYEFKTISEFLDI